MKKLTLLFLILSYVQLSAQEVNLGELSLSELKVHNVKIADDLKIKQDDLQKKKVILNKSKLAFKNGAAESLVKLEYILGLKGEKKKSIDLLTRLVKKELLNTKKSLRKVSRRYKRNLKCLRDALSNSYQINKSISACGSASLSFNIDFKKVFDKNHLIIKTDENALRLENSKLRDINAQVYRDNIILERQIVIKEASIEKDIRQIKIVSDKLEIDLFKDKNKEFFVCNQSTPTIDLESETIHNKTSEKGVFVGIGRDHQDGIGTCFANTAKNLLLGLSGGEMNASFLDMALQYKKLNNDNVFKLDGGQSCIVLDEIAKNGYCPKKFSPIESGDSSQLTGGLFHEANTIHAQSRLLEILSDYLKGKNILKDLDDPIAKKLVSQSQNIIKKLLANPNIKIPLPKVKGFPFDERNAKTDYTWSYKKKVPAGEKVISKEKYLNEYNDIYQQFTTEYFQALRDGKSFDVKKEIYNRHWKDFNKKFNLNKRFSGVYYKKEFKKFFETQSTNQLLAEIKDTLQFYNEILDPGMSEKQLANLYTVKCYKNAEKYSTFTKGLTDLLALFKDPKINADVIFDDEGNPLDNAILLQLATAPKCLNPKNRKKMDFKFSCEKKHYRNYTEKNKHQGVIDDVVKSLMNNMPVGNTFKSPYINSYHINTIVGYRYNPTTKSCQFKIRESQTAKSDWHDAEKETAKIYNLTVIGRK